MRTDMVVLLVRELYEFCVTHFKRVTVLKVSILCSHLLLVPRSL
jgi:hypothetical protein